MAINQYSAGIVVVDGGMTDWSPMPIAAAEASAMNQAALDPSGQKWYVVPVRVFQKIPD